MSLVRTHNYAVGPADLDELLARRATLISTIRAAYAGLAETRLTRLEDGTYTNAWRWDTADHMRAARPAAGRPPVQDDDPKAAEAGMRTASGGVDAAAAAAAGDASGSGCGDALLPAASPQCGARKTTQRERTFDHEADSPQVQG